LSKRRVKRDELTIIRDILRLTVSPTTSTKILYRANLSYTQFKSYVDLLVERGFLRVQDEKPPAYVTTSKGKLFLRLIAG
jgi:predicted transcriptional regulator